MAVPSRIGGTMLDTIILVTGPTEQPVLAARLRDCNGRIEVLRIDGPEDLMALDDAVLRRSRLIAFATGTIVPAAILDGLGYGAYNFHPGPPEFPGLSPSQLAVYRGVRHFGVTVHHMAEKVDAGPIVDVSRFDVPPCASVAALELRSYQELAFRFWQLSPVLANREDPLPALPVSWSSEKSSRRSYAALCAIPPDISAAELDRRIGAFGEGYFGLTPTVTLHGHRFQYVPERPVPLAETSTPRMVTRETG